jgi:hypothetical protein
MDIYPPADTSATPEQREIGRTILRMGVIGTDMSCGF